MRHAGDGRTFIVGAAVLMAGLVIVTMLTINAKLENALAPRASSRGDPSLKVVPLTPAPPLQVIAAPSVAPVTATVAGDPLPDPGATLPAPVVITEDAVTVTATPRSSAGPAGGVARGKGAASRPARTSAPAAPSVSRAAPAPVAPPPVAASPPVAAVGAPQSDIGDPVASRGEVSGGIRRRQGGSPQFTESRSDAGHHHCDREDSH